METTVRTGASGEIADHRMFLLTPKIDTSVLNRLKVITE